MVRHIVLWRHKEGFTEAECEAHRHLIKEGLEGLVGVVPGLVEAQVYIDPLASSNRSWMLDSRLESKEALAVYKDHPAHKEVSRLVHEVMEERICFDVEE